MGTMAHLVRLLSKLVLVGYLLSCSVQDNSTLNIQNEKAISTYQKKGIRYVNDSVFTGILIKMHPNEKDTISSKSFVNGLKEGKWWVKYPNLEFSEIRFFKEGNKEGLYQGWWPNGKLKFEYHFENDEYQGEHKEWNPEGRLVKEMHFEKGHEKGSQKVWYDNGKVKSNYVVKNDRRYGLLGTKNCVTTSDSLLLD